MIFSECALSMLGALTSRAGGLSIKQDERSDEIADVIDRLHAGGASG
jgi:hypothetical protein